MCPPPSDDQPGSEPPPARPARPFVHPGLLTTEEDLAFIRARLQARAEPWWTAWGVLAERRDYYGQWTPRPAAVYTGVPHWFEPGVARDLMGDGEAAYSNTLLWLFGDDSARAALHQRKAIEILDAWSATLQRNDDLMLFTSYSFPVLLWAAELLRTQGAHWPDPAQQRFTRMVRELALPHVDRRDTNSNWRSWGITLHLAAAIYLDDRSAYDQALARYHAHLGRYIRPDGHNTELRNRDPDHASMGAGPLALICEMAWHQGDDLYGLLDNRLARSFERCAPVYAGDLQALPEIRQRPWVTAGRANALRPPQFPATHAPAWPIFECVHNHYVNRCGMVLPQLTAATRALRPELFWRMGWGTLLHARDAEPPGA